MSIRAMMSLADRALYAANLSVNSSADSIADDGQCTLREAIRAANTDIFSGSSVGECAAGSGADTISFDAGIAGQTIALSGSNLMITSPVTLDGSASPGIIIDGPNNSRIFDISGGPVTIQNVTLQNGKVGTGQNGGAIRTTRSLTLSHVQVLSSTAGEQGGGVYSEGALAIADSLFENNQSLHANPSSDEGGGAIYVRGSATITDTHFISNTAQANGGAIRVEANEDPTTFLILSGSRFEANSAQEKGGAISMMGDVVILDTVFVNNKAWENDDVGAPLIEAGGAVFVTGQTTVSNSLFTNVHRPGFRIILQPRCSINRRMG